MTRCFASAILAASAVPASVVNSPRDLPPLAGELVEDVLDGTMFVKHETTASLYHELFRLHERTGGTIFKDAAKTIRAQRKRISRARDSSSIWKVRCE
jgi:hypothetical protein